VRIAFDFQAFVRNSYGGISRYFTRLARDLSNVGQEVGVFAPLHQNCHLSMLPRKIVRGRYASYPPEAVRLALAYNRFRYHFQISGWEPDVVHETYYARIGSAPRACPTVITVHDMIHELFPDEFPVWDRTAAIKRAAVDRADHVICVSENTRSDLMRLYGTPTSKLSVVHHGSDQLARRMSAGHGAVTGGRPFLLYVGERKGYKNFSGLLKAVASSRKLVSEFDIVAFGGPRFSPVEMERIASLGFAPNQVLHKSGGDDHLGSLYSSARALVYPSLYEGFGFPPLEAMAHRCPVISSNSSAIPEITGSAGEYFDPTDIDDMRRAIEAVVYSDSRVENLRKAGAERLRAFSWKKCVQETLDIYRSLI